MNTALPEGLKIFKFDKFKEILKTNVDLIVLGISSKGIDWVSDQLSAIYKVNKIPNLLMLTKGLSIYKNKYELLVDKLERLLNEKGISKSREYSKILFKMNDDAFDKHLDYKDWYETK